MRAPDRLRDLALLLPLKEYVGVRRAIRDAAAHIEKLEERVVEQDKHLEMLRAQLLKTQSALDRKPAQ